MCWNIKPQEYTSLLTITVDCRMHSWCNIWLNAIGQNYQQTNKNLLVPLLRSCLVNNTHDWARVCRESNFTCSIHCLKMSLPTYTWYWIILRVWWHSRLVSIECSNSCTEEEEVLTVWITWTTCSFNYCLTFIQTCFTILWHSQLCCILVRQILWLCQFQAHTELNLFELQCIH